MAKKNVLFYSDRARKNEITQFVFPRTEIGEDSTIFFYMYNTSKTWPLKKFIRINPEVETELSDLPKTMGPEEVKELEYKWSPKSAPGDDEDEPLKTFLEMDTTNWIG